jgi:hypothetical protein
MDDPIGNVRAREAAEEAMGFVREVEQEFGCTFGKDGQTRFWEKLKELVEKKINVNPPPEPMRQPGKMTNLEARRFGHELIPFGEFRGKRVDEVPLDRLRWYADQMSCGGTWRATGSRQR